MVKIGNIEIPEYLHEHDNELNQYFQSNEAESKPVFENFFLAILSRDNFSHSGERLETALGAIERCRKAGVPLYFILLVIYSLFKEMKLWNDKKLWSIDLIERGNKIKNHINQIILLNSDYKRFGKGRSRRKSKFRFLKIERTGALAKWMNDIDKVLKSLSKDFVEIPNDISATAGRPKKNIEGIYAAYLIVFFNCNGIKHKDSLTLTGEIFYGIGLLDEDGYSGTKKYWEKYKSLIPPFPRPLPKYPKI